MGDYGDWFLQGIYLLMIYVPTLVLSCTAWWMFSNGHMAMTGIDVIAAIIAIYVATCHVQDMREIVRMNE